MKSTKKRSQKQVKSTKKRAKTGFVMICEDCGGKNKLSATPKGPVAFRHRAVQMKTVTIVCQHCGYNQHCHNPYYKVDG